MADAVAHRRGMRRQDERMLAAALSYAALGWAVCPGAHPLYDGSRACSCDRIGCPAPGAHPVSPAWQLQAAVDDDDVHRWWTAWPDSAIILPTGRVFDVFDVPAAAGRAALRAIKGPSRSTAGGPVAAVGDERYLFFTATRGAPDDEDEFWTCHLDCLPATIDNTRGLRWHCRDSYVLAPPSRLPGGGAVSWVRRPGRNALPDPVALLNVLADYCD